MVSREDKFMIFSIWKTSLGFIIAFSLQLLFFSMIIFVIPNKLVFGEEAYFDLRGNPQLNILDNR